MQTRSLLGRYFYFLMSLLIAGEVVYSFSFTVAARLFHPAVSPPFIVYIHAAFFSVWVLFFILQTGLVRTRNVQWHRRMGYFGAALGGPVRPALANGPEQSEWAPGKLHEGPRHYFCGLSSTAQNDALYNGRPCEPSTSTSWPASTAPSTPE